MSRQDTARVFQRRQLLAAAAGAIGVANSQFSKGIEDPEERVGIRASAKRLVQNGQRLVCGYSAEPLTLDPGHAVDRHSIGILQNVTDSLVEFGEEGDIRPALAVEFQPNEDATEWTFQLREDVKFHDDTEFNAEVVKANMDRLLENKQLNSSRLWSSILDGVDVTSPFEVRFHMRLPTSSHLAMMAGYGGMMSPAWIEAANSGVLSAPIGTGAFTYQDSILGDRIILAGNTGYWDAPPTIAELEFVFARDRNSRSISLLEREIDVAIDVSSPIVAAQSGDLNIFQTLTPNLVYWAFNMTKDIFQDPLVRQAFNYAIDRDFLVQTVLEGAGQPADAPIPPPVEGYESIGT